MKINELKELKILMQIGNKVIDEIKKQNPNIKIEESYKGKFLPFILEYVNKFIVPNAKIKDLDDTIKHDLWCEVCYIECFCKWLDEEKGIKPKL